MIPLKIDTLLEGQVVERNRVEYKEGWNPSDIIHTICAFANDYSNVNGGYLVIGVAETDGIPLLPPKGIEKDRIDMIQKEIFQYCNMIEPRYIPMIEVVDFHNQGIHLLYLKCSPGDAGPYQAPADVYSKKNSEIKSDKTMKYWIRPASLMTAAKKDEIAELFEKFNAIPYDDRVNRLASKDNIRRAYIEDFLRESDSTLSNDLNSYTIEDLLISVEVANEMDTKLAIRNVGLMMFADSPDRFIPGAQIDLVRFNSEEAEASDDFIEKTFKGPIWKQIRDALEYISTTIIEEKVVKIKNRAEAERFYNYPYNALEEALVNAVFHKSYKEPEPVEIRIYVDCIQIINYPGPAKWIDMDKFATGKVRARKYRNRRIGEFFKEIDLSEKQSTGISKILKELKQNGSPLPEFETDEDRTYLITTIRVRDGFDIHDKNFNQKNERSMSEVLSETLPKHYYNKLTPLIEYFEVHNQITPKDAEAILGKSSATTRRYLAMLVDEGVIRSEGSTNKLIYLRNQIKRGQ